MRPIKRVSTLLRNAAEYIREHGWCQHAAVNNEGNVCTIGAISKTAGSNADLYYRALDKLKQIVGNNVVEFNDKPGRTKREVLAVFKKAEKLALAERV